MSRDEAYRALVPCFRREHWVTYALCLVGIVGAVVVLVITLQGGR